MASGASHKTKGYGDRLVPKSGASVEQKPQYILPLSEHIPADLKVLPHWVLWRAELVNDRWSKVPYQVSGHKASSTNPSTWASFDAVWRRYTAGGYDGIGIVLTADIHLVGVDLDHCITDGTVEPWAMRIIACLQSYTEYSPSRTGIRIFCQGSLPVAGKKKGNVEFYQAGRYLTVTGAKYERN